MRACGGACATDDQDCALGGHLRLIGEKGSDSELAGRQQEKMQANAVRVSTGGVQRGALLKQLVRSGAGDLDRCKERIGIIMRGERGLGRAGGRGMEGGNTSMECHVYTFSWVT